jgi:hypothetical protein
MDIPEIRFDHTEALQETDILWKNTLVVSASGPRAYSLSEREFRSLLAGPGGLGMTGIHKMDKYKNPLKWYITLTDAARTIHYNRLHGQNIKSEDNQISLYIEQKEKEKSKATLSWVPSTMKPEFIKKIAVAATGDRDTSIQQIGNTNRYHIIYKPSAHKVPHYVNVFLTKDGEESLHQIYVVVPGRRTQCVTCGLDTHWSSQCPERRAKQTRTNEYPQLQSHAEQQTPVEKTQTPADETQTPTEETQIPTEETQTPAEETQPPQEQTTIPQGIVFIHTAPSPKVTPRKAVQRKKEHHKSNMQTPTTGTTAPGKRQRTDTSPTENDRQLTPERDMESEDDTSPRLQIDSKHTSPAEKSPDKYQEST